jgi:hypothetical protein
MRPSRFLFGFVTATSLLLFGCATQRSAARGIAARELACPEDAITIAHDEGRLYRATGCGGTVRVACYDPHDSTGASWGWADPLTAGNRVYCETIVDRSTTTSALVSSPSPAKSEPAMFDRDLAAKVLAAASLRAKTCGGPNDPQGEGWARVTFAANGAVTTTEVEPPFSGTEAGRCVVRELERVSVTAFAGHPVSVRKRFEIAR